MEAHLIVRPGDSAGARMDRANLAQISQEAVAAGLITGEEFDRMLALLDDSAFSSASSTMFMAWGRRP